MARARRSVRAVAGPLAAEARLSRRLAGPAREGERTRGRVRRAVPDVRLCPARPQLRTDRAVPRAVLAPRCIPPGPLGDRLARAAPPPTLKTVPGTVFKYLTMGAWHLLLRQQVAAQRPRSRGDARLLALARLQRDVGR